MVKDKKILTLVEFEKIIENASEKIYDLASLYIAILARDAGISFETISTEFGNQADETELFLEEANNEYGVDLRSVSEDEFLDKIPESYKDIFKQIKEQYLNSNVKEVSEADSKAYNLLRKEVAIQEDKVARNISNYNLSQIPSDRYAHAKWIRKVNFENTGAKLDLKQFDFNVYITGSIKGCELISFAVPGYRKIIDDGSGENTMIICPSKELLDENQYETVIEGYKDVRTLYITTELCDLLKDPELQKKNEWLFDKAFKGENISYGAWRVLIPELKNKHPEYFESIKNNNRIPLYNLSMMILPYTPTNLLEENINWLNSFSRKEDGTIDFDVYIRDIFGHCNSEFQMNHFDEILTEIKDDDEKIQQLWTYSKEEVKEKNMLKILDAIILEGNVKDSFSQIIRKSPKNIPQECLDKVFKLYENENSNIRSYMNTFWENMGKKNQEKYLWPFMQKQKNLGISSYEIYQLWKSTDSIVRYNYFDTVLTQVEKNIPELEHIIKGKGYIDIFFNLPEEKVEQYISNNIPKFLSALRYKYNVSIEGKKDFDAKYDKSFARVLFELEKQSRLNSDNLNIIIDNLPKLGKETINRIFNSNSEMVVNYAPQLISAVADLDKKEAIETIEKIEHIFSQDNLPTFMRIYKYFELVVDKDNSNLLRQISSGQKKDMSPVLSSTRSESLSKRIILADLMKISMDSNNKSLRKFVDKLEKGNEIYVKFVKNGRTIDRLTEDEKQEFKLYIKTIHSLYEESGAYNQDKERGMAISLSGDIQKDAIALGNRYAREGLTNKLPDLALQSIIGPYQELFAGITTISKVKEYMDSRLEESNKRHRELAKEKLNLEEGDLIKGIKGATGILQDLFGEGIRAGEFLGVDSHSDATPLDTDFSLILPQNNETNLNKTIRNTASSSYGNFFIVLKHSSEKMEFTRTNQSTNIEESTIVDSIDKRNDSEQIRLRIQNRANATYENKKLEVFASNAVGKDHYGIRTGIGSTDIDYIIVEQWNKKIGYELAMNGTYIPVINVNTEELIFTPEQYDEIRTQMQGLSYYNTGKFIVDETAYVQEAKHEKEQLFTDFDSNISISELEATKNRNAIKKIVEKALLEKMELEVEDHVTGNLQNGFVELIDTGSTGRGTNLPGDGDFDFTLKVDKVILEDPMKMKQLKSALREVLARPSSEKDSKIEEPNGQFRYKKVIIEGAEKPLDIDITFMQKDGKVTYSTDMCVRDRFDRLKRDDPEGYKYVISNIVLAKKVLKEEGLYKKFSSPDATEYGGFGGVGVENWILENGGSFAKAMDTFIDAASKSKDFEEFKDNYPIYDFGQNHMAKSYQHDSFVNGITSQGYTRMQERFKELRKELTPISRIEKDQISIKDFTKKALKEQGIGIESVQEADKVEQNSIATELTNEQGNETRV